MDQRTRAYIGIAVYAITAYAGTALFEAVEANEAPGEVLLFALPLFGLSILVLLLSIADLYESIRR